MIVLIGTGHVFDLSNALMNIFNEREPDAIAVELDKQRYTALIMKRTDLDSYKKTEKNVPIIYRLLSQFQNNMAREYGVSAGDEMLMAINYAQSHQIPLEFIDMNAQKLFSRMLKSMPLSEKLRMFVSGIGGVFISKKRVEKELEKIEGNFDTYIEQIGEKFPTIKRVLIDERNAYMTQKLAILTEEHDKVIAVIGDGHIPGVSRLLGEKNIEFETIRLSQLRNQRPLDADSSTASFSMEYKET
jgi:pheromone shutdown protein TraB